MRGPASDLRDIVSCLAVAREVECPLRAALRSPPDACPSHDLRADRVGSPPVPHTAGLRWQQPRTSPAGEAPVQRWQSRWQAIVRPVLTVRWQPGQDTLVALGTLALMIGLYYANSHARQPIVTLIWLVAGNLVLNVLFPAWYVLRVRRERLDALGITTRWWWLALLISLGQCLRVWGPLQQAAARRPDVDLLAHMVGNGLILWEPFFVYGWLQLRYERAFGIVPGIVLTGASFAAYHVGSYPPELLLRFFVAVTLTAALYRITRNLLAVWPLTHAFTSALGTLGGGFVFDWSADAVRAAILAVQVAGIVWLARCARQSQPVPGTEPAGG